MAERAPIDWDAFRAASDNGPLMELLAKLPRERWAERDDKGRTLIHYACRGPNSAATVALLQGNADGNARDMWGWTPAHYAASFAQPCVLEILCAAGVNLRAQNSIGNAPLDFALGRANKEGGVVAHVLMANGVRPRTVRGAYFEFITSKFEEYERCVLRCRTVVAALLRVKKAGELWRWDKFLLREVAYVVWATRYEEKWQN